MYHIKQFAPSVRMLIFFGIVAVLAVLYSPGTAAHANPFYVGSKAKSATATTTLAYLTPAVATSTTPVYDSYEINGTNQTNGGNLTVPDSVAFLIQGQASSTATVINAVCEYGDDEVGSTGIISIDWYQNEIVGATTTNAGIQNVNVANGFTFTYASTTVGGVPVTASTNRFQKVMTCPVPTRYVRAVVSVTGAGAGVWLGIVPKKQRN